LAARPQAAPPPLIRLRASSGVRLTEWNGREEKGRDNLFFFLKFVHNLYQFDDICEQFDVYFSDVWNP